VSAPIFVAADLLDYVPRRAVLSRRTLVTVEVTEDIPHFLAAWPRTPADDPKRPDPLRKPGEVTVLTTLLELQQKGIVDSVEQTEGGFLVCVNARENGVSQ
jgi:hypothetical protein